MKNIKRILVLIIMAFVSVFAIVACGDPYKDMTLTIAADDFEDALERRYEYNPYGNSFEITATVGGAGKKVSTGVVFESQDKNIVMIDGDPEVSGATTIQSFNVVGVGETVISVYTVEGGLSANIEVEIFANPESISFISENTIPIIKGSSVDLTRISSTYSKAPIKFEPSYTTEKDVEYSIFEDVNGLEKIYPGTDYVVEGNTITFSKDTEYSDLYIMAETNNGLSTKLTHLQLLNEIDLSSLGLSYTFTLDDTGITSKTFYDVDRSSENGIDYQLYLADQYAGDQYRDAKNIYLTKKSGNRVDIVSDYSVTLMDKSINKYSYIYSNEIGTGNNKKKCFSICNGDGEGNSDIIYFNINYAGFEDFFNGYEIVLKVTIDAFPSDVVISHSDNIEDYVEKENILVFNNYVNKFGTPFYVKILNKGNEFISSQFAYVNVWDVNKKETANREFFTIYDENGSIITPYTRVKSGSLLFIKYNAQYVIDEDTGLRVESKPSGNYVLYASSVIDSTVTSLEDINGDESYEYNNISFAALNYNVNITDSKDNNTIIIALTGDEEDREATIKFPVYSESNKDYPIIEDFVVELANNDIVDLFYESGRYYVKAKSEDSLGGTSLTVVAPNGTYDTIDIFVTKNPQASDFVIQVGNVVINEGETITINMNVSSRRIITIIVDGVQYSSMPYGYEISITDLGGERASFIENNSVLISRSETTGKTDEYTFTITYAGNEATSKTFILRVNVVKPVTNIVRSNAVVDLLYMGSIDVIDNPNIDKNVGVAEKTPYTDITDRTSKTVEFTFNPSGATIDVEKLSLQFKYSTTWRNIEGPNIELVYEDDVFKYMHGSWTYEDPFEIINNDPNKKLTISFNFKMSIVDNKIVIEINDIDSNKKDSNGITGVDFTIRVGYEQNYNLSVSKQYYVGIDDDDNYFIYSNIDNPNNSRVIYVGGYRISSANFVEDAGAELMYVNIGGIDCTVSKIVGKEDYTFLYDTYKIDMYNEITFSIEKPVKTSSITLTGVNQVSAAQTYYIGGTDPNYYLYTDIDNESTSKLDGKINNISYSFITGVNGVEKVKIGSNNIPVIDTPIEVHTQYYVNKIGGSYFVLDRLGTNITEINGYTITQSDFTEESGNVVRISISGRTYDVYTDIGDEADESDDVSYFYILVKKTVKTISYTSKLTNYYTITINKNELDVMNKKVYYIGTTEEGDSYLYTNRVDEKNSRVSHIGAFEINNDNFDFVENKVTIGPARYNILQDGEISYIEVTTFKVFYRTAPASVEVKGILFRQKLVDGYEDISEFVYYNDVVIGAATNAEFSIANGISISVNYLSDFIEFQILDNTKFVNFMQGIHYNFDIELVAVDSASTGEGLSFGVSTSFKLTLATGTADNPYILDDAESFEAIHNDLTAYYKVIQNISLYSIKTWVPIGNEREKFTGTIYSDSAVYTISDFNFTFNYEYIYDAHFYGGLFGYVGEEALFENLVFKNFRVSLNINEKFGYSDDIYLGGIAGRFEGTLNNCTIVDDESTNYGSFPVSNISNMAGYGVIVNSDYDVYTADIEIGYYVGGVFGEFLGTANKTNSSVKVYVKVPSVGQETYIGGFAGLADDSDIKNAEIYSVIYTNNQNVNSYTGGVVANLTNSVIRDANITTYINAYDNVGGVAGYVGGARVGATDIMAFVKNVTIVPYIYANDKVGGVVGQNSARNTLESVKVQFIDKNSNGFSYENSSIIANNHIGGLVGYSTSTLTMNYCSVMGYVNEDITLYGSANEAMISKQNFIGDIISVSDATTIGGFIGTSTIDTSGSISITNGYSNIKVASYGILTILSTDNIYYGGLIGRITNRTKLTINDSAVDGVFYYLASNFANAKVVKGGFIGIIPTGFNFFDADAGTYVNEGYISQSRLTDTTTGLYLEGKELSGYNIYNSYTALKHAKITQNPVVAYVDNFVGYNETFTSSYVSQTSLIAIEVRNKSVSGSNYTFTITYTTPFDTTVREFTTTSSNEVSINFGKLPNTNISWEGDWSTSGEDFILSFTPQNGALYGTYDYSPIVSSYEYQNILTFNSFYMGFETKGNVLNIGSPDVTSSGKYFNIVFNENGARSEFVEVNDGSTDYRFNYYTQVAYSKDASNNWTNKHYVLFDNMVQLVSYVGEDKTINVNAVMSGSVDATDTYSVSYTEGQALVDRDSSVNQDASGDKFITSILKPASIWEDVAYVVTSGTKLKYIGTDASGDIYETNQIVKDGGYKLYFNNTKDGDVYNIINGFAVPFADFELLGAAELSSDIPMLVVDIQPVAISVEVKPAYRPEDSQTETAILSYFSLTTDEQVLYNRLSVKANRTIEEEEQYIELSEKVAICLNANTKSLADILDISVIPEIASADVLYESSNKSVFIVSGNNIIITGEGTATLTVRSKLNAELFTTIDIVVVGFDYENIKWELSSSNSNSVVLEDEVAGQFDIIANDGDLISSDIGYKGGVTFGIRYKFNKNEHVRDYNLYGKTLDEFMNSLVIAGYKISNYVDADGNVSINIDGLNHSFACAILGNVKITQTLYFKYSLIGDDGKAVGYYKYFEDNSKEITYSFREGLYGVSGSDELNFVAINRDVFSVVLEYDGNADSYDLNLEAGLNGVSKVFENVGSDNNLFPLYLGKENSVGGYLTIELDSKPVYDASTKLKTYTFSVYIDEEYQPFVNNELQYFLKFFAVNHAGEELSHTVIVNVLPQEVDSVYINH